MAKSEGVLSVLGGTAKSNKPPYPGHDRKGEVRAATRAAYKNADVRGSAMIRAPAGGGGRGRHRGRQTGKPRSQ